MFWTVLLISCIVWTIIAILCNKFDKRNDYMISIISASVIEICIVVIMIIVFTCVNQNIINNYENLTCLKQKKETYIIKRDTLQKQYELLLNNDYGNYESKLFDKMTKNNKSQIAGQTQITLNAYPSPKYSETIIELSKKIQELNGVIYDCDLKKSEVTASLRATYRSQFLWNYFLPNKIDSLIK